MIQETEESEPADSAEYQSKIERPRVTEYPLDSDVLGKGSALTVDDVEGATGVLRGDPKFGLKRMELATWIRWKLSLRGLLVITKSEALGIRILTDAEAVEYTDKRFRSHMTGLVVMHTKATTIDHSNLNDVQTRQLETNLAAEAFILHALKKAEQKIAARKPKQLPPSVTAEQ